MTPNEPWLTIGKLVAPQGLKGEIRIHPSSDFPERFTEPGKRWLQLRNEEPKEIELTGGRKLPGKSLYIVSFGGISNRSKAEELIGSSLLVPSTSRPKLAKGEFHLLDLVGLEARLNNPAGPAIGEVINLTFAGNDLIEIRLFEGRNVLIPFVNEIVPTVDLEGGWLLITPPPGLLEL